MMDKTTVKNRTGYLLGVARELERLGATDKIVNCALKALTSDEVGYLNDRQITTAGLMATLAQAKAATPTARVRKMRGDIKNIRTKTQAVGRAR